MWYAYSVYKIAKSFESVSFPSFGTQSFLFVLNKGTTFERATLFCQILSQILKHINLDVSVTLLDTIGYTVRRIINSLQTQYVVACTLLRHLWGQRTSDSGRKVVVM